MNRKEVTLISAGAEYRAMIQRIC